jgi:HSP20 family protein
MVRSLIPRSTGLRPWTAFERDMENWMNRFFGGGMMPWSETEEMMFTPEVNLAETDNEFEVSVELPGLKPEDVHVELSNGNLVISGEKKEEKEEKGKTFHRIERHFGEFRRTIPLDVPVEEEKIDASFRDGVLTVMLPKSEQAKPKSIEVKT